MNDEPQHKHRKYWLLCIFAVFIAILGIILPEFEPTPITYINASNITTVGANAIGSLQNITEINNGYYNVSEINAQPYYVIVNFTNITNFSFLEVKAKYFSVSGTPSTHIVDMEIFCEIDQDYEDVFFLENSAEWRYFTRHFPDSMHFIDSRGNVSIKFNHTSNGNVNHRLYIDVVRLIILPQYALNTVTLNQYFNNTTGTGSQNLSQVLAVGNNAGNQSVEFVKNINMTGSIIEYRNNDLTGSFGVYHPNLQTSDFFLLASRYFSEPDVQIYNSSCLNCYGGVFSVRSRNTDTMLTYNILEPNQSSIVLQKQIWQLKYSPTENFMKLVNTSTALTVSNLSMSGSGNYSIVIADSTGKLIAVPMNGTGNHYGCWTQNGYPYPGNPGC